MHDDQNINPTWAKYENLNILLPDNIEIAAIDILLGEDSIAMPVPPSQMVVHPYEFMDEDQKHDYDLIYTCPVNFPDVWEDERLEWAEDVCQRAKTTELRNYGAGPLVRRLLWEHKNLELPGGLDK